MGISVISLANHSIDTSRGGESILKQVEDRLKSSIYRRTAKDENYWPVNQWATALLLDSNGDWAKDADESWNDTKDFRIGYQAAENQPEIDFKIYPHLAEFNVAPWSDWRSFSKAFIYDAVTDYEMTYRKQTASFVKKMGGTSAIYLGDRLMDEIFDWEYNDNLDSLLARAKENDVLIWDVVKKQLLNGFMPSEEYNTNHQYRHFILLDAFSDLL